MSCVSRCGPGLGAVLDGYQPLSGDEARDLARIRALAAGGDPWARSSALHVTGSALIVHPETRRVLLRWHDRMQGWLHVGGHGGVGETSPLEVALREATEETGLGDLSPWPDAARPLLVHVVIVPVPAGRGEPEHEHADLRYVLATGRPEDATAETPAARLRWLSVPDAMSAVAKDNLRISLARIGGLLRRSVMAGDDFPAPGEGFVLTHFIVAEDVARSRDFYVGVLGGKVVLDGEPTIVKLANGWVIINVGGGPTDDKPEVVLEPPRDPNRTSAFLNIRVADIQAVYREWSSRGAVFLTEPKDHGREIRCYMRDPDGHLIEVGQATGALRQQ